MLTRRTGACAFTHARADVKGVKRLVGENTRNMRSPTCSHAGHAC
jgi:hypothetical protein